jgi:hypothetical protein
MSSQAAISAIIVINAREAGPFNGWAIGKIQMDDLKKAIRRNKLLGMWTAEKLGITGRDAEAYSDALAVGTLDPERSDVFSKIRKDFDAAGVVQSDEQIVQVMNELMLKAGNQVPATAGGALDVAALMLARKLKSRRDRPLTLRIAIRGAFRRRQHRPDAGICARSLYPWPHNRSLGACPNIKQILLAKDERVRFQLAA